MKWIKFTDRIPKVGQKVILQKNYKSLISKVYKVDRLMQLAFYGAKVLKNDSFRWKPYTERKPERVFDSYIVTFGPTHPNIPICSISETQYTTKRYGSAVGYEVNNNKVLKKIVLENKQV